MEKLFSKRGIAFLLLFAVAAFISMRINFSPIIGGNNQFFTMFQFFGPIAGGFLGIAGVSVVAIAEIIDFLAVGKEITLLNLARLLPMLFAAYYFSQYKNRKLDDGLSMAIPLLAMLAFWLHPIGREAWYFALFWSIPIIAKFLPENLLLRSFGSTFTAHAVGGALWIWTVSMTAAQWNMLIPVVAFERSLFAIGIVISYVALTNILNATDNLTNMQISKFINIERKIVFA